MQLESLSKNINFTQITDYLGDSNYLLPLAGLFFVRFFLPRLISGSLGLLAILAAVLFIVSRDPGLSSQLSGFTGFGDVTSAGQGTGSLFGDNSPWILGAIFLLVLYLFRPIRFSLPTLLLFAVIGYALFFRDYRPETIISEGNWKTTAVGIGLLIVALFFYRARTRYGYYRPLNFAFLQPVLLVLALSFCLLIVKNPAWLEASLPGWRHSIGYAVLIISAAAFFYNLPIRFRPYAISACWLFVVLTVGKAVFKVLSTASVDAG